jgi:hypothetical protein
MNGAAEMVSKSTAIVCSVHTVVSKFERMHFLAVIIVIFFIRSLF